MLDKPRPAPVPARPVAAPMGRRWVRRAQWHATAVLSWRTGVALLLLKTGIDAGGLWFGGAGAYRSHAYDLLRHVPGGMRGYSIPLAALFVGIVLGLAGTGPTAVLRTLLAVLAGWNVGWLLAICGAAATVHAPVSPSGVGSLLLVAGLSIAVARRAHPPIPARQRSGLWRSLRRVRR